MLCGFWQQCKSRLSVNLGPDTAQISTANFSLNYVAALINKVWLPVKLSDWKVFWKRAWSGATLKHLRQIFS